jgi:hypothetical protein
MNCPRETVVVRGKLEYGCLRAGLAFVQDPPGTLINGIIGCFDSLTRVVYRSP